MTKTRSTARGSIDMVLLMTTTALVALGLMMAYGSSAHFAYQLTGRSTYFFHRQLLFCAVGAVGIIALSRVDYHHLTKISIPLMASVLIMLVVLVVAGKGRQLVGPSGSPAEFAKLALVIYIAHWLASKRVEQLRKLPVGPLPFTIIVGIVAGLVMVQPDVSEALVMALVAVAMYFLAGADWFQFLVGTGGGAAAFVFVIRQLPTARERFEPFWGAWRDPIASTDPNLYQLKQGLIGLGSGGIFGVGPGNGRTGYSWLPAAYNDQIFAVVGEELGLVGCLVMIGLFALLIYRGFQIARQAPDSFGSLLAVGVTCWIGLQALINMAVVTGTIPSSGLTLPFVSNGGSSLLSCMVGVGIMLSVSRAPVAEGASSHEARGVGWRDGRTRLPGPGRDRSPA